MKILAIDPGNVESAFLIYDMNKQTPAGFGKVPNAEVIDFLLPGSLCDQMGIETMKPRGMPTSFEEMQTQLWAGRFIQAWLTNRRVEPVQIFRMDVKLHITGQTRAKDSNIRQCLIDRYGGKDAAIGKKKSPGPLFGISADVWSALAIAITFCETKLDKKKRPG